jgi:hypothetical protein
VFGKWDRFVLIPWTREIYLEIGPPSVAKSNLKHQYKKMNGYEWLWISFGGRRYPWIILSWISEEESEEDFSVGTTAGMEVVSRILVIDLIVDVVVTRCRQG